MSLPSSLPGRRPSEEKGENLGARDHEERAKREGKELSYLAPRELPFFPPFETTTTRRLTSSQSIPLILLFFRVLDFSRIFTKNTSLLSFTLIIFRNAKDLYQSLNQ